MKGRNLAPRFEIFYFLSPQPRKKFKILKSGNSGVLHETKLKAKFKQTATPKFAAKTNPIMNFDEFKQVNRKKFHNPTLQIPSILQQHASPLQHINPLQYPGILGPSLLLSPRQVLAQKVHALRPEFGQLGSNLTRPIPQYKHFGLMKFFS